MSKDEGGFVYPQSNDELGAWGGLSKRDWLAGLAMQGMMDGFLRMDVDDFFPPEVAVQAYQIADALIQEGNK